MPAKKMVGLLEACFFPKWHRALHTWLAARPETPETEARDPVDPVSPAPPDLERVTRWYLGWKSLFSEDLLAHERVRAQINVALDMMNQAAAGGGVAFPGTFFDSANTSPVGRFIAATIRYSF